MGWMRARYCALLGRWVSYSPRNNIVQCSPMLSNYVQYVQYIAHPHPFPIFLLPLKKKKKKKKLSFGKRY